MMQLQRAEGGEKFAISRNMSTSGALLATSAKLEIDEPVSLTFQITPDDPKQTVKGKIVRLDENAEDPKGHWPHRVAVEFEELQPEVEVLLREAMDALADKYPAYFED